MAHTVGTKRAKARKRRTKGPCKEARKASTHARVGATLRAWTIADGSRGASGGEATRAHSGRTNGRNRGTRPAK
eukprot:11743317-Alexandrium_andersonii.AAC.1